MTSSSEYWASVPREQIGEQIKNKWDAYRRWLSSSGYLEKMRTQYALYYGLNLNGLQKDGSLTRVHINMFRNAIDHVAILVNQNKLNYEFGAINTDTESLDQVRLGRDYMKYVLADSGLDGIQSKWVLTGLLCNESFLLCDHTDQTGVSLAADPDTGEMIGNGEQRFVVLTACDVARDVNNSAVDKWKIIRLKTNKFDLAAVYTNFKEGILSSTIEWSQELTDISWGIGDEENCYTYYLWHEKTASMPHGRQVLYCNGDVLFDKPMFNETTGVGYKEIPCHRFAPGEMINSITGSSFVSDIVGPQQALSKIATATLSNELNLNLTAIYSRNPIDIGRFQNGFQNFTGGDKPEAINLGQSNPQSYQAMGLYGNWIDKISGIGDLVRGAAPQGVTAASGMALLLSQAIAFASPISRRFANASGRVATTVIDNVCFLKEEILISMVGKTHTGTAKKIHSKSFSRIQRVVANIANPLAMTQHGNQAMAMEMLKSGQVKDIRKIFMIADGAPHEILYEREASQQTLLEAENDALREGINPPSLLEDNHDEHIDSCMSLLNTPWIRSNPRIVEAVLAHSTQHKELKKKMLMIQQHEALANVPPQARPPDQGQGAPAPQGGPAMPPPPGMGAERLAGVAMPSLPPTSQGQPEAAVPYAQAQQ